MTAGMSDRHGGAWARVVLAGAVTLASAVGCKRADPAATAQPAPKPEVAVTSSAVSLAEAPTPPTSAEAPSPGPEASAPANTAPADAVPRFYLVAETAAERFIAGKSGALLVRAIPEQNKGVSTSLEIIDDRIVKAPHVLAGIEYLFAESCTQGCVDRFGGSWPDAAYAVGSAVGYRWESLIQVHVWDGKRWIRWLDYSRMSISSPTAVTSHEGTFFAAVNEQLDWHIGGRQMAIYTTGATKFKPRPVTGNDECATRLMDVVKLAVTASGDLLALGKGCSKDDLPALERFNKEGTSTGVFVLPTRFAGSFEEGDSPVSLATLGASEVYVAGPMKDAGKPLFVQLKGSSWKPVAGAPFKEVVTSLDAGSDGALWVVSGGAVFRRPSGGAWVKVEMPADARANRVQVTAGDVWVFGAVGDKSAVFRTRPMKYAVKIDAEPAAAPASKLVPSRPACKTPFVLLYKMAENAAPNYDFPKTREALAGHTELAGMTLVVTDQGYFGATVPTHEVGEKLVEVVKGKVKGARPQVVCMTPKVQEEIPIDLATGKVKRP